MEKSNPIYDPERETIVGESEPTRWLKTFISKVSPLESTVLITGPSGSGKELVADLIHSQSKRAEGPFIKINCAAIPEGLLESELFGYDKGAFTGAYIQRAGKFELANKGTILLDEIGDMPLGIQAKLLRVVEYKQVEKLGTNKSIRVDTRIVAATNKDLGELVRQKKFREDLYYRLNVVCIHVPPLQDRMEDLPILARHLLKKINMKLGTRLEEVSSEGMGVFYSYDWPGNVREFANVLERAAIFSEGSVLTEAEIRTALQASPGKTVDRVNEIESRAKAFGDNLISLTLAVQSFEKSLILDAMLKANGIQTRAAEILGLSSKNLWKKIQKHSINTRSISGSMRV